MGSSIRLTDLAIPATREDTEFQRGAVADLLGRNQTTFPGAQPVSFARHHLRELQEVDYFMCEKTDGIRCLLYLTQHIAEGGEMIEAQYLIDRKNDYYYIRRDELHIPRASDDLIAFHTGTLLDGELVRQKFRAKDGSIEREQITYLIFDRTLCATHVDLSSGFLPIWAKKESLDGSVLSSISQGGRSGMRIDIVNIRRFYLCVP